MKISKEQALEYLDDPVLTEPTGQRFRWAVEYRMVFLHTNGLHYEAFYRQGTGDEAEQPWQDEREVECFQVEQATRTILVWERV